MQNFGQHVQAQDDPRDLYGLPVYPPDSAAPPTMRGSSQRAATRSELKHRRLTGLRRHREMIARSRESDRAAWVVAWALLGVLALVATAGLGLMVVTTFLV